MRCANWEAAVGVGWEVGELLKVMELLNGCMKGEWIRQRMRNVKEARRMEPVWKVEVEAVHCCARRRNPRRRRWSIRSAMIRNDDAQRMFQLN